MRILAVFFAVSLLVGCSQPAAKPTRPTTTVHRVWSKSALVKTDNKYLRLKPFYQKGKIYVANASGNVAAIDASTGSVLWRNRTKTPIRSGVTAGNNNIFVGTAYGDLIALDKNNGAMKWYQSFESGLLATPTVSRGVVMADSLSGQVSAYHASNGHLLWNQEVLNPTLVLRISGQAAVSGSNFIVPFANGQVTAYKINSGLPVWRQIITSAQGNTVIERMVDISTKPVVVGSKIFIAGYQGYIAALAASDGHLLWRHKFSTYSGMGAARGALFASDKDGNVLAISQASGRVLWKQNLLAGRWAGVPAYCNGIVFVGDGYGYLYGLRASDGTLVYETKLDNGPIISAPIVVGKNFFVASTGGVLARFSF